MIRILADHNGTQQAGAGQPLLNRLARWGCDGDVFLAAAAGVLSADVLQHLQHGRHEFQLLAPLATDPLSLLAALGAALLVVGEIVFDGFAGEMVGQCLSNHPIVSRPIDTEILSPTTQM